MLPVIFLEVDVREKKVKACRKLTPRVVLGDGRKRTEIPFRTADFLTTKHVRTGSGVHPAYTPMGTGGLSRDKTAVT
jgi:hypothetical protein